MYMLIKSFSQYINFIVTYCMFFFDQIKKFVSKIGQEVFSNSSDKLQDKNNTPKSTNLWDALGQNMDVQKKNDTEIWKNYYNFNGHSDYRRSNFNPPSSQIAPSENKTIFREGIDGEKYYNHYSSSAYRKSKLSNTPLDATPSENKTIFREGIDGDKYYNHYSSSAYRKSQTPQYSQLNSHTTPTQNKTVLEDPIHKQCSSQSDDQPVKGQKGRKKKLKNKKKEKPHKKISKQINSEAKRITRSQKEKEEKVKMPQKDYVKQSEKLALPPIPLIPQKCQIPNKFPQPIQYKVPQPIKQVQNHRYIQPKRQWPQQYDSEPQSLHQILVRGIKQELQEKKNQVIQQMSQVHSTQKLKQINRDLLKDNTKPPLIMEMFIPSHSINGRRMRSTMQKGQLFAFEPRILLKHPFQFVVRVIKIYQYIDFGIRDLNGFQFLIPDDQMYREISAKLMKFRVQREVKQGDRVCTIVNRRQGIMKLEVNGVLVGTGTFLDDPTRILMPFVALGKGCEVQWIGSSFYLP